MNKRKMLEDMCDKQGASPRARHLIIETYLEHRRERILNIIMVVLCFMLLPIAKGFMILFQGWVS